MDELIGNAFMAEIAKLAASHSEIMKKLQTGSMDTGEPNKPSPIAATARKFDPKVIKQQILMKEHGKVSKAKQV